MTSDDMKLAAARRALDFIEPGMKIGLGSGSTAAKLIALLGERVAAGLQIVCVPTSEETARLARAAGIPLTTLDDEPILDLTIDGADEFDAELRLIKGGGGALLREKIVACSSDRMVVIADHTKRVETLGAFPLPVEVVAFGLASTRMMVEALSADVGCEGEITVRLGTDGKRFVTDGGNHILDCAFGRIPDAEALDDILHSIPGVVETGLFLGIAEIAIIGTPTGVEVIEPEDEHYDATDVDDDQGERPS
jgi:ribose 5-phosphate isomerase A